MKEVITIFSDSHGDLNALDKLRPAFLKSNKIVFLGDGRNDLKTIALDFGYKTYMVDGNCDGYSLDPELIFSVGNFKILAVHGHRFYVKDGLNNLILYAKEQGCNVALFGHTHLPTLLDINGVKLINPGTISLNGKRRTYCVLEIDGDKFNAKIEEFIL